MFPDVEAGLIVNAHSHPFSTLGHSLLASHKAHSVWFLLDKWSHVAGNGKWITWTRIHVSADSGWFMPCSSPSQARQSAGTRWRCRSGAHCQHPHHKLLFLEVYDLAIKCCLEKGVSYHIVLSYKRVKEKEKTKQNTKNKNVISDTIWCFWNLEKPIIVLSLCPIGVRIDALKFSILNIKWRFSFYFEEMVIKED